MSVTERLSAVEAERDRVRNALADEEAKVSAMDALLSEAETEKERVRDDSQHEIERVKRRSNAEVRQAQNARERAEAETRANEGKLAQRYQETATLTNLLKSEERRAEQADERLDWVLILQQRLAQQPRWWALMPKSWQRRRTLEGLRAAGIFDGEAYLRRYQDVAGDGMCPLEHYLKHGLHEGRSRGF